MVINLDRLCDHVRSVYADWAGWTLNRLGLHDSAGRTYRVDAMQAVAFEPATAFKPATLPINQSLGTGRGIASKWLAVRALPTDTVRRQQRPRHQRRQEFRGSHVFLLPLFL